MPIQITAAAGTLSGTVGLDAGVNSIGTVGLDAVVNSAGTVGLDAGVNSIGDVGLDAGATVGLEAGVNSIGDVGLDAGVNSVGTVGLDAGANGIGDVGLDAGVNGVNNIGDVDLNAGTNLIGQVQSLPPTFYEARSDKDTHFTGAIAKGAKEDESLTGLQSNNIIIKSIVIISKELIDWAPLFWDKNTFDDADLDVDSFMAGQAQLFLGSMAEPFDSKYYYFYPELNMPYKDTDASKELHVSLMVEAASANAKAAGAGGEVIIRVFYNIVGGL